LDQAAPRRGQEPALAKAGVEWHPGELYPRVGFIVTNLARLGSNAHWAGLPRFTIAEDAQKSEPSLTITGNPGNVD
jgi:hypothetical protein